LFGLRLDVGKERSEHSPSLDKSVFRKLAFADSQSPKIPFAGSNLNL
jgi:hypothetical protein